MSTRRLVARLTGIVAAVSVSTVVLGQAASAPASGSSAVSGSVQTAADPRYSAPRTAWGHPDIAGIWNNVTATPLQRPAELKDKAVLSAQEAAEYEKQIAERQARAEARPHTGYAASIWFETGHTLTAGRTSLITDPADGRLPALTPEGQKIADYWTERAKLHPADTPEDRGPYERCITRGLPGAMMPGFYNHNYQILQTKDYVAIHVEMIHDARIIPIDGRPHVSGAIKQWLGDSRGRWEGDTLVVETRNLRRVDQHNVAVFGTSEQGRVIERFRRTGPGTMDYQVTVDDPATFTRPWSASIPMSRVPGPVYEYMCHEGNYALPGILAGHRREEREAAQKR